MAELRKFTVQRADGAVVLCFLLSLPLLALDVGCHFRVDARIASAHGAEWVVHDRRHAVVT